MRKEKTVNFYDWDCALKFQNYPNGNLKLDLIDPVDGMKILTATIYVPLKLPEGLIAIKDNEENEGLFECLFTANVISPPIYLITGWDEHTVGPICKLLINPY